jgi:hypothetical protein
LKSVNAPAPAAEAPAAPAAEVPAAETPAAPAAEEAAQQAKRQTSRIELPPELTDKPMSEGGEAKAIELKPISETAAEASENPQAAKSKTARIELDAVLGGIQTNTPLANTTQKTIKLKRAVPAGGAKPTTSAPIGSAPAAPTGTASEAPTIKLKRPTSLSLKKDAPAPAAADKPAEPELESLDSLESLEPLDDMTMMPLVPAEESAGKKAFTAIAIAAAALGIIATIILCVILQKHAASPDGSAPTGNTLHSLPFERF